MCVIGFLQIWETYSTARSLWARFFIRRKTMQYTKAILQIVRLNDLREIARNYNIKSPTSKRKQQLIDEIINAQNGIIIEQPSNRGRKPFSRILKAYTPNCDKCKDKLEQLIIDLNNLNSEYYNKCKYLIEKFYTSLNN